MNFIGIDVGITGAVAIIKAHSDQKDVINIYDNNDIEMISALAEVISEQCMATIEKVQAFPGQGVSSMFKFGEAYGKMQGFLIMANIPFQFVTPTTWQKEMFDAKEIIYIKKNGLKKKDTKTMSLDLARRLFPCIAKEKLSRKKDHNRADALLIAEYTKRTHMCF